MTLSQLNGSRLRPNKKIEIRFNVPEGRIGLRAVDMPSPDKPIEFMPRANLDYDVAGIKVSSRLLTFIEIPQLKDEEVPFLCDKAKGIFTRYRKNTMGFSLSPFKGNNKAGTRRRRLDYATARAILEKAFEEGRDVPGMSPKESSQINPKIHEEDAEYRLDGKMLQDDKSGESLL